MNRNLISGLLTFSALAIVGLSSQSVSSQEQRNPSSDSALRLVQAETPAVPSPREFPPSPTANAEQSAPASRTILPVQPAVPQASTQSTESVATPPDSAEASVESNADTAPVPAVPERSSRPVDLDPTRPSPELLRALELERSTQPEVERTAQPAAMPSISIKGRLIRDDANAEALLEIDGSLYRVVAGEKVLVTSARNSTLVEIVEISRQQIRIKLPQHAEPLTLR